MEPDIIHRWTIRSALASRQVSALALRYSMKLDGILSG